MTPEWHDVPASDDLVNLLETRWRQSPIQFTDELKLIALIRQLQKAMAR